MDSLISGQKLGRNLDLTNVDFGENVIKKDFGMY